MYPFERRAAGSVKVLLGATLFLVLGLMMPGCQTVEENGIAKEAVPPRQLQATGAITLTPIDESSGLIKSNQYDGVFWTHNDSGDAPRLFAITDKGKAIYPKDNEFYAGVLIEGAKNVDWEDIAMGPKNQLIIADLGNNRNERKDLTLYLVPEPNPYKDRTAMVEKRCQVSFPEQEAFPPEKMNFDCEAIFVWKDSICFLTKNRSDNQTQLYSLPLSVFDENASKLSVNPLTLQATYSLRGMVTAADSYDGRIAVLTYGSIWVFEPEESSRGKGVSEVPLLYSGKVWWQPIRADQCESIAFIDQNHLLIGNEQRKLFKVPVSSLQRLR